MSINKCNTDSLRHEYERDEVSPGDRTFVGDVVEKLCVNADNDKYLGERVGLEKYK